MVSPNQRKFLLSSFVKFPVASVSDAFRGLRNLFFNVLLAKYSLHCLIGGALNGFHGGKGLGYDGL